MRTFGNSSEKTLRAKQNILNYFEPQLAPLERFIMRRFTKFCTPQEALISRLLNSKIENGLNQDVCNLLRILNLIFVCLTLLLGFLMVCWPFSSSIYDLVVNLLQPLQGSLQPFKCLFFVGKKGKRVFFDREKILQKHTMLKIQFLSKKQNLATP